MNENPRSNVSNSSEAVLVQRHLRIGWWMLAVFVTLGLVLEGLHAFKAGSYLGVKQETRRLMWTLAHAHGTLLGILNLCFVQALLSFKHWAGGTRRIASTAILWSALLLPAGFFLGGMDARGGDPGAGILLVPAGGVLLLVAVWLTAMAAGAKAPVEPRGRKGG